jgi:exodeoxyribonuclease V beta subunit
MGSPPFSLTESGLPAQLAIEASAGTGKTYALAGLAARLLAEGQIEVSELLVVTFTRAAAAELRDRIRSRLALTAEVLGAPRPPDHADPLYAELWSADRPARLQRVRRALTDFDSATIGTIHSFAQQMLGTLGVSSGADPDARLADDADLVVDQVCTDLLAARALTPVEVDLLPSLSELRAIVDTVLGNPGARTIPGADPDESDAAAALCAELVEAVVAEVHRRRRATATLSFDDLLTQLRDALARPDGGAARQAIRHRFEAALIDEFQDTDPVQWEIFRRLFVDDDGASRLVLVGDPKQAIYSFRGANVHTYLRAVRDRHLRSLDVNWRSDPEVLQALEVLLEGTTFGDADIDFVPVGAAPSRRGGSLRRDDASALPAVDIRTVTDAERANDRRVTFSVPEALRAVSADVVAHVVDLLDHATIPDGDGTGADAPRRRVLPRDVAVLVCRNAEGAQLQRALERAGVPAVVQRGDSVLGSEAAMQWRWLLTGLTYPARPAYARTAALSWFFGWTPARLDQADEGALAEVQEQLAGWADVLATRGVISLCRQVWAESGVAAAVLGMARGDRHLTDLEHVAELLQESGAQHSTPAGLLAALATLDREARNPEEDVAARRIESDADAVQIMTVWAAKGLEFPVVCVPTLWRNAVRGTNSSLVYEDPTHGRTIAVAGGDWPDPDTATERRRLARVEEIGEHLRLLYVALTRAEHHTAVWWCNATSGGTTALARVLFARDESGTVDAERFGDDKVKVPTDAEIPDRLAPLVERSQGALAVTSVDASDAPLSWRPPDDRNERPPVLSTATLDRSLDRRRKRWSFTAISARAPDDHFDADGELPDEPVIDEPGAEGGVLADELGPPAVSELPLGDIAAGAVFGTLVHEILEHVDCAADDLDAELAARVHEQLRWTDWPVDPDQLVRGLRAAIETPLGASFAGRSLRDLGPADRLAELSFELVLGEGGTAVTDRAIGELLVGHLDADDPVRPWADRLAGGLFGVELAGHLTGEIDAVFRVADGAADARFVVVDYKTNALHQRNRPARIGDYHPERLAEEMDRHHYPMQALLYSVALHRYLRWRIAGYDPDRHLGGVAYLFLRGLAGPDTPVVGGHPHGVFAWRPPAALVDELSDRLDGSAALTASGAAP